MNVRYLHPCPQLQPYVDYYLLMDCEDNACFEPVRVFPKPQAEMVFHYRGKTAEQIGKGAATESNNWAVSGFFTQSTTYRPEGPMGVVMVGFKPWGIQPFLNFHAEEITDTNLDLALVYPKQTREVAEKLMEAGSTLARVHIIETFLVSLLNEKQQDPLLVRSIHSLFQNKGIVKVHALAEDFCLSEKQFVRRFRNLTGVTPKFFARLVRFQYILKLMESGRLDLLGQAVEAGFHDLPHFTREFAAFTGTTPLAYLKENRRTDVGIYFDSHIEESPFYYRIYQ